MTKAFDPGRILHTCSFVYACLWTTWLALLTGASAPQLKSPPEVRDVGDRKQLFIDHRFIERFEHVQLTVNPPLEHVGVLPGPGHEDEWLIGYFTVIQEEPDGPTRLYAPNLEDYSVLVRKWLAGELDRWPERSRGETPPIRNVTLRLFVAQDGLHLELQRPPTRAAGSPHRPSASRAPAWS